jgi:hypothetical protein
MGATEERTSMLLFRGLVLHLTKRALPWIVLTALWVGLLVALAAAGAASGDVAR